MNADEAGGQNLVAAVAIPVHDVDAVDHAFVMFIMFITAGDLFPVSTRPAGRRPAA